MTLYCRAIHLHVYEHSYIYVHFLPTTMPTLLDPLFIIAKEATYTNLALEKPPYHKLFSLKLPDSAR
jgi:hypothetical protein